MMRRGKLAIGLVSILALLGGIGFLRVRSNDVDQVRLLPMSKWGFSQVAADGPHSVAIIKRYGFLETTKTYPR